MVDLCSSNSEGAGHRGRGRRRVEIDRYCTLLCRTEALALRQVLFGGATPAVLDMLDNGNIVTKNALGLSPYN